MAKGSLAFVLGLIGLAATVQADVVVAPNALANAVGGSGNNAPTRQLDRTYQAVIAASEFTGLNVGDQLTGLYWRAFSDPTANPATWPPAGGASWVNFDIYISTAATTPATISNTFAANDGPDRVTVRSGPYTVAAGSYVNAGVAGVVSPWGPLIAFAFNTPFTYAGGGLTLTVRHQGNAQNTSLFLDTIATANTALGYGTKVAARAAQAAAGTNYTATVGPTINPFAITQFEVTRVPAPGSLALLGLGGLALSRRRRA